MMWMTGSGLLCTVSAVGGDAPLAGQNLFGDAAAGLAHERPERASLKHTSPKNANTEDSSLTNIGEARPFVVV